MGQRRILIVEDEVHSAQALGFYFRELGFEVATAGTVRDALAATENGFAPDVLLTDVVLLGEGDGFTVARALQQRDATLPVVVMSGLPTHEVRERATGVDVFEICAKPLRLARVAAVVGAALETSSPPAEEGT
ncbi:MAG TPA: response regulator [Thermoanaerobaculia bacterium]|nr:response regulator [Thermoanaerobaculia bacterium]